MERIDRYEVESVLGTGAFATVWLARDPVLDLRVAIKVLADNWSRDPGIRARFIEEARVLWQADSPRIVRVHHVGELEDGRPYFAMGWADRGNLRERMQARFGSGSAFSIGESASISAELCRALRDVHDLGRMHRDVKPANVLVRTAASRQARHIHGLAPDEQLVLADFGLARQIEASAATMVSGSPAYVAPEQARGQDRLDERADIYPLGLILIELLTGLSPAERSSMIDAANTARLDLAGHLSRAGVTLPPRMQQLAEMMVEPDPANRLSSAGDIAIELDAFVVDGDAGSATTTLLWPGQGGHRSSNPPAASDPGSASWPAPVGGQALPTQPSPQLQAGVPQTGVPQTGAPQFHSAEPVVSPGEPVKKSRLPLLAALGAAVAVAGIVVFALVQVEVGTSPEDPGTTATSLEAAASSGSVSVTSGQAEPVTTAELPEGVEFISVPLPEFSRLEAGSDDIRQVANVATPVAEVTAFYETLVDDDWQVIEVTPVGDDVEISMASAYRTASVTLTKAAVTAGDGITRIEVLYSRG